MTKVCEPDQYFPASIIKLTDHESFVDIGAFDGDTVRDLRRSHRRALRPHHLLRGRPDQLRSSARDGPADALRRPDQDPQPRHLGQ